MARSRQVLPRVERLEHLGVLLRLVGIELLPLLLVYRLHQVLVLALDLHVGVNSLATLVEG